MSRSEEVDVDPDQNFGELINALLEKTRRGRLAWASTPVSGAYNVAFLRHSITVRRVGSRTSPQYSVALLNSAREEIKSFLSTMPGGLYYSTLEEIFHCACRKAMAADEAIAQIQAELAKV